MNPSKSAKIGFSMLRFLWHGPRASQIVRFCWPRLSTMPTILRLLQAMCFLLMHTTRLAYVDKGRQQTNGYSCSSQIHADAVRGVCALENSSSPCSRWLHRYMQPWSAYIHCVWYCIGAVDYLPTWHCALGCLNCIAACVLPHPYMYGC